MSRIAYVNGRYLPLRRRRASHIEDRGYQFGDGVYEVCEVRDGALIDETRHLARLERSLAALRIADFAAVGGLAVWSCAKSSRETACATAWSIFNRRAASRRATTAFPTRTPSKPRRDRPADRSAHRRGARGRGRAGRQRCPMNALERAPTSRPSSCCPTCSPNRTAREQGAPTRPGCVDADGNASTEGASTNAWIRHGQPMACWSRGEADQAILRGVARTPTLLAALAGEGLRLSRSGPSRSSEDHARRARGLSTTSADAMRIMPVVAIDGRPIGDGRRPVVLSVSSC